jgi:hypothetical protein
VTMNPFSLPLGLLIALSPATALSSSSMCSHVHTHPVNRQEGWEAVEDRREIGVTLLFQYVFSGQPQVQGRVALGAGDASSGDTLSGSPSWDRPGQLS